MQPNELKQAIRQLLAERDAILLAHNYQRDEIQEIADITGDSLGLSMTAARTEKRVIVFCGVHFMAESAAILAPDKTVLLPREDAGCPMADMVTAEGLCELKAQHPGAAVVTYVNSSAAVKAESDICCTSANAVKVAQSLPQDELILVPDRNLGDWIARHVPEKRCISWPGYCPTHERLTVAELEQAKAEHPDALTMVHPECPPAVVALADAVLSTGGMLDFAQRRPERRFIVATEMGLLYRLRNENPDKEFILPSGKLVCPNMKLTALEDVYRSLETLSPRITVPADIAERARHALDRMLAVPRD